ncbi:UvrD-helicase domain-containing protein [Xenorhabdus sp. Sc-CR9]|uniref:UvrD-helicase domain-containing protein n=1 Tax=Xenorhabdus sp. Sc-CR9 TaxID=2584468 RepID=UPI001EFFE68F|nr:UvrD-helicase domain-containing protein [Xenorhabdus sp. Sc-CR9]
MSNKLIIACAGAGKTHRIVSEAINSVKEGEKILIVTYTINNQEEIYEKYKLLGGNDYDKFKVKGFFLFYWKILFARIKISFSIKGSNLLSLMIKTRTRIMDGLCLEEKKN